MDDVWKLCGLDHRREGRGLQGLVPLQGGSRLGPWTYFSTGPKRSREWPFFTLSTYFPVLNKHLCFSFSRYAPPSNWVNASHCRGVANVSELLKELNISPETCLRRKSFAQPDQHFYGLVLKQTCYQNMILAGSPSREELNRSETFEPKSAFPTVG